MTCPSCNRQNAEGLVHCDFCGTALGAPAPSGKRKTEAEGFTPSPGGKRKTEIEAPAGSGRSDDAFDPFRPAAGSPAPGGFQPLARGGGPTPAPSGKRKTEFDSGGGGDPFAKPPAGDIFAAQPTPEYGRAPTAGRRIVGWLVTFDGNPDGSSYILREGRNTIGRDAGNDVVLTDDTMVSATHAYVIWRAGRARIADNNSNNGTFLNDEDVLGQVEMTDDDIIKVGRTQFIVRLLDQARVAALWKPATGA